MSSRNSFRCMMIAVLTMLFLISPFRVNAKDQLKPRMEIKPVSWDFGKIREGKVVKHIFVITNRGNGTLVIESALESCECVTAKIDHMTVEPGKNTNLIITFASEGESGSFSRTVSILSNDPDVPMRTVKISGKVEDK